VRRNQNPLQLPLTTLPDYNQEKSVDAAFLTSEEIESHLKSFVAAGANMPKAPGESDWKDPQVVYANQRGKVGW
jgi:hypothetical protein